MNIADRLGLLRSRLIYNGNPFKRMRMWRLYRSFVPPGSLCFDIGAHVGDRTALLRSLGARVIAVEPQTQCLRILKRRFGRDSGVTLLACALGAEEGNLPLKLSPGNPTLATLSGEWIEEVSRVPTFKGILWTGEKTVTVTTFDRLIDRYGVPSFAKIDVEGFEARVLQGLSNPVKALSFEYLPASLSAAFECLKRLPAIGDYQFNISEGEGFALEYRDWVDASEIRRRLSALGPKEKSGDVYARLKGPAL